MKLWEWLLSVFHATSKSFSISIRVPIEKTGYVTPMNDMDLTLNRMIFTDKSTIGELWLDGKFFCYTLEPTSRSGPKVPAHTAVPAKRYRIALQYSNKFGKKMPFLMDVPDFEGIMIHPGNFPNDTEGCILTGDTRGIDYVGESRVAFDRLFPIIQERSRDKLFFISILGGTKLKEAV